MSTLDQLLSTDPAGDTIPDMLAVIKAAIRHQPRSMQKLIGPSEIGTDCDHCLAAKLAGWEETERDVAWLPFIGTAVHAALAEFFEAENHRLTTLGEQERWRVEHRVEVGTIGAHRITGTCDLYDVATGTVVDFKIVGAETLRTAKAAAKPVYRTQVQLYGLGYLNAGFTPHRVAIAHLPRNAVSLSQAVISIEEFRPAVAHAALERANKIHANLQALASINTDTRDTWITTQDRAPGCFSCPRYPDWAPTSRLGTEFGISSSTDRKAA